MKNKNGKIIDRNEVSCLKNELIDLIEEVWEKNRIKKLEDVYKVFSYQKRKLESLCLTSVKDVSNTIYGQVESNIFNHRNLETDRYVEIPVTSIYEYYYDTFDLDCSKSLFGRALRSCINTLNESYLGHTEVRVLLKRYEGKTQKVLAVKLV